MRTDCCYTKGFVTILFLKVSNLHVISNSRYLYPKKSTRILNKLTSFFHCWNALWDKSKFKIFSFLWGEKLHKLILLSSCKDNDVENTGIFYVWFLKNF